MDDATAKELLGQIKQANPELPPSPNLISRIPGVETISSWFGDKATPGNDAFKQRLSLNLQNDALKDLVRYGTLAMGAGAAIRGVSGMQDLLSRRRTAKTPRVVDMPVPYPVEEEKTATDPNVTSKWGMPWYTTGMLLGVPLAAYGGWKGVDSYLNHQKKRETEDDLDRAKQEYQQAMLSSYKTATDQALDQAFDAHEKAAGASETAAWLAEQPGKMFPNTTGATKGLALAYTLAMLPAGYHMVNKAMKSRSQEALLRKATQERARRQALTQPPELYAVPTPMENLEEE